MQITPCEHLIPVAGIGEQRIDYSILFHVRVPFLKDLFLELWLSQSDARYFCGHALALWLIFSYSKCLFSHPRRIFISLSLLCILLFCSIMGFILIWLRIYLIRKCKRNFGLTPHKFHLQNRIRKAQTLLFTNKSVTEASMDTGFYDQSHFDRAFKNIVGISPTEYLASSKTL